MAAVVEVAGWNRTAAGAAIQADSVARSWANNAAASRAILSGAPDSVKRSDPDQRRSADK